MTFMIIDALINANHFSKYIYFVGNYWLRIFTKTESSQPGAASPKMILKHIRPFNTFMVLYSQIKIIIKLLNKTLRLQSTIQLNK
jgi:hypothetical protein